MEKLFAIKDEKSEFYAQVEVTKNIWKFLNSLANKLFDENWMIDSHYQAVWNKSEINDYFNFEEEGVRLIIIMAEKRANIIILGLPNNKYKEFFFENYSFD